MKLTDLGHSLTLICTQRLATTSPLPKFIAIGWAAQSESLRCTIELQSPLPPVSSGIPPPGWTALGGKLHVPPVVAGRAERVGDESGFSLPQTVKLHELLKGGLRRKKVPGLSKREAGWRWQAGNPVRGSVIPKKSVQVTGSPLSSLVLSRIRIFAYWGELALILIMQPVRTTVFSSIPRPGKSAKLVVGVVPSSVASKA